MIKSTCGRGVGRAELWGVSNQLKIPPGGGFGRGWKISMYFLEGVGFLGQPGNPSAWLHNCAANNWRNCSHIRPLIWSSRIWLSAVTYWGHFLMIVNLYHEHVESRHRLTPELFFPTVCLLDRNLDFGYTYTVFWCVIWLSKVVRRTRLDDYTFFHSPVGPVTFIPLPSHGWIIGWNWYEVSGCQIMHNYQRYG